MNEVALIDESIGELTSLDSAHKGFVTVKVDGQLFGISVLSVRDVLRAVSVASIPLAPSEIAGLINLRGRIVTVVDVRRRLNLPPRAKGEKAIHVVVEYNDELYSMMVDSVGDVLNLPSENIDKMPENMDSRWREIAVGVCRLESELLIILDVQSMLTLSN